MPKNTVCQQCGKTFASPMRGGKVRWFCSAACYAASMRGPRPDLIRLEPKTCPQCGKSFQPRSGNKIFCSRQCASSWNQNPAARGQGQTRVVKCTTCGTPFERSSVSHKYCSHKCYTDANTGAANHRFSDFITQDERGYLRYTSAHPEHAGKYVHAVVWDTAHPSGVCEKCGGQKEVVHHIDSDKSNNELANLMGLCHSCHAREHDFLRQYYAARR